jgi:hypothetical protein
VLRKRKTKIIKLNDKIHTISKNENKIDGPPKMITLSIKKNLKLKEIVTKLLHYQVGNVETKKIAINMT